MNFLNLGPVELAVIAGVALVVLGPRQLPELGRMLGRWMRTFREAADEMRRSLYMEDDYRPPPYRSKLPSPSPSTDDPAEITEEGLREASSETEKDSSEEVLEKSEGNESETDDVEREEEEERRDAYAPVDYDEDGSD